MLMLPLRMVGGGVKDHGLFDAGDARWRLVPLSAGGVCRDRSERSLKLGHYWHTAD